MSSSRSGQWIPDPAPMNSHRRRSAGRPSASLGYQSSGTDTVRPSPSSTTRAVPVTRTSAAMAASLAGLEVLMPCLRQFHLVLAYQAFDLPQDGLDSARTSRPCRHVQHARESVRCHRSNRRRSDRARSAAPLGSFRRFCQFFRTPKRPGNIRIDRVDIGTGLCRATCRRSVDSL